jgi:hypothetical protein
MSARPTILLSIIWYLLVAVTAAASAYGCWLLWERFRPARFEELSEVSSVVSATEVMPVGLTFSRINLQVPLVKGEIKDDQWATTEDAASFITYETRSKNYLWS